MTMMTIDLDRNPNLQFRIDRFSVPEASRAEFEATMHRSVSFIRTLPGFLGHIALEKTDDPAGFNIMTIATWESREAFEKAGEAVRAYYGRIGFDMPATLARLGVTMERGNFRAPREMQ